MEDDELPDLSGRPAREPDPGSGDGVNHLAYIFLALIVILFVWYGLG